MKLHDPRHDHARRCKLPLDECKPCQLMSRFVREMNPEHAATYLQDSVAPPMKTSIAAVAIDRVIEKSTDRSVRGRADYGAGMNLLKTYEEMGGSL